MHGTPGPTDCLIVLGSRDDRVAVYAPELAQRYPYSSIVKSGGRAHHNDLLATKWQKDTEAEQFAEVMRGKADISGIHLENEATNTGENALYSYDLLKSHNKLPDSILIVTKPYMERRALATFEKQWPGATASLAVTSPQYSFEDYCNEDQPVDTVINIMVGDLQRIMEYPKRGLQTPQHIPEDVVDAYEALMGAGYTKHLL